MGCLLQSSAPQEGFVVFYLSPSHISSSDSVKGYSGVAIYTRNSTCAPIRAEEGITGILTAPKSSTSYRDLPQDQHIGGYPRPGQLSGTVDEMTLDSEGRCVALEFPGFVLLGVYSPANRDEFRDDFRVGFLEALDIRIRNLIAEGKQVILTGDLNIIRSEMDSTNVAENIRKSNMTMEEWESLPSRRILNQLLFEGSVRGERDEGREHPVLWDLCRCFHPTRKGMNTCWDTKKNTRPANYGSRIDYVLCSDGLKDWFIDSNIQEGLMGSDHCPVFATASDTVKVDGREVSLSDLVNPPGMFEGGKRLREWGQRDLLPLSAKLIPEFDRRQSIRDMFTRKATCPDSSSQAPSTPDSSNGLASAEIAPRNASIASTSEAANQRTADSANSGTEAEAASFANPQKPYAPKRPAEPTGTPPRSKRSKQGAETNTNTKPQIVPGQKTLRGFFKPKNAVPKLEDDAGSAAADSIIPPSSTSSLPDSENCVPLRPDPEQGAPPEATESSKNTSVESQKVFDPIQAKESWSKLLGKRVAPLCEHKEPCISLTTKKPGVNCGSFPPSPISIPSVWPAPLSIRQFVDQTGWVRSELTLALGRSFYICPRPLGPSGEKEKDSEWRCGTFIWSSDWNKSQSQ